MQPFNPLARRSGLSFLLFRISNKGAVPHPLRRLYREMGGMPMHYLRAGSIAVLFILGSAGFLFAQSAPEFVRIAPNGPLDPAASLPSMPTIGTFHTPLPEEYMWTANDAAVFTHSGPLSNLKRDDWKVEPRFFRRAFPLSAPPPVATLYVAGPRKARVWINGTLAAQLEFRSRPHTGFATMTANVARFLRPGNNTIAIEAVRGYGSHHHTNAAQTSWLNSGEVLVVKILPAELGVDAKPLLISDGSWKSSVPSAAGWEQPDFDDAAWKPVTHLGIESSADFFQWNADTGIYDWPGYLGEAPYMANYRLAAVTSKQTSDGLLLDFGRELNGRVVIQAGAAPVSGQLRYGESTIELRRSPFLGAVPIHVPARGLLRGPKTGFRYALVSFDGPHSGLHVEAEGIVYPVRQVGNFSSNDPLLNRIWESSVYTAHLCMQDSILDGIKRDRGLWIGDSEVIHRTIADVYGDSRLVKAGLEDSLGPAPVKDHINGLPGYSAWWVVAESEYVQRWGDLAQLKSVQSRLVELLQVMERELDANKLYAAASGNKPYVDWAPGLSHNSPEARRATHFEYLLAFRRAAWLLQLAGDTNTATRYAALADAMTQAAQQYLRASDGSYGERWQTNSLAVLSGAVTGDAQRDAVWRVLAHTGNPSPKDRITPYYGSYLLSAMASLGHRAEALAWIKNYWGGMLANGATSFWEAWDPAWAGADPHLRLEADDKVGTYTSLAHGWASSPAPWLLEQLLGVTATEPGYRSALIRPDLAGLETAQGDLATPLGPIHVEIAPKRVQVTLPAGIDAKLLLPAGRWLRNGKPVDFTLAENGARLSIQLPHAGQYEFVRE